MRTLLANTSENIKLLEFFKIKITRSVENASYILVKGMRAIGTEDEDDGKDYRTSDKNEIVSRLEDIYRQNQDLLDILEDGLEVSINLQPLNIGREKLSVEVRLVGKRIASETKIITTNGLGQRATGR